MRTEIAKETERYIPITVCPDCVQAGLQIDPRVEIPTYPVYLSTCYTHLIIRGEIHPLLNKHTVASKNDIK